MLCDMERDDPEPEDIFDRIGFSVAKRDELIADYTFEEKKLLQLACMMSHLIIAVKNTLISLSKLLIQ